MIQEAQMRCFFTLLLALVLVMLSGCGKKDSSSSTSSDKGRDRDREPVKNDDPPARAEERPLDSDVVRVAQRSGEAMLRGDFLALADCMLPEMRGFLMAPVQQGQMRALAEQWRNAGMTIKVVDFKEDGDLAAVVEKVTVQGNSEHKADYLIRRNGQWYVLPNPGAEQFLPNDAARLKLQQLAQWATNRALQLNAGGGRVKPEPKPKADEPPPFKFPFKLLGGGGGNMP
jgi:major membrane immunogen (membrane-anchored lipoprotein)